MSARSIRQHSRRHLLRSMAVAGGMMAAAPFGAGRVRAASLEHPVVKTSFGPVRGYRENGVQIFKGIRYGADTAPRRFQPPAPPMPWSEVLPVLEYGPAAPQDRSSEAVGEDCLFLNVWTPEARADARRPVMFYIHGGAYSHGSGASPLYDGRILARRHDAVVVTVNHRLNAFGYLYLRRLGDETFADSGNAGQLDLVMALRWVNRNIAAFGGDPERVMAFGQSGGGAKIATLMAMPAADGLFHRAATMSGQQVTASGPHNATLRTAAYLEALKIAPTEAARLRTLPMGRLIDALPAPDPVLPYGSVYFGPVLDMRSLTRHPFYPDAHPQSAHVPMIIGNTRHETRAFLREDFYHQLRWEDLPELLIHNMRVDIRPEYVVARYRELYPEYSPSEVFFGATTAARSWRGAVVEAEARARQAGAPTWAYQLDWTSPLKPELGAPHSFDIPLVFGTLDAAGSLTGTGADARAVSAMMSGAFAALAHSGSPQHDGLPEWRPYTLPGRDTLIVDRPPRMARDPRGEEREIFARVPYVQPGT